MRIGAHVQFALVSFVALAAGCGDGESDPKDTQTTTPEVTTEVTTSPDADVTTEPPEVEDTAEVAPVCEHACKSAFGTNDKSLCPVPQADWNCVDFCCVPVFKCKNDDDCAVKGFELEQCTDDRFACRCDGETGGCFTWFCGVNDDCRDGEVCSAGACIAAPATTGLSIRILDRAGVLVPGAKTQLRAEAYDPDDDTVVVAANPTWSSSDSDVVAVDAQGLLTGGSDAGTATITAKLGDATDTIVFENVLVAAGDTVVAIVRTELTMEPVVGDYLITNGTTNVLDEIPADGVIRYDGTDGPYDLHVMAADNDWVSWIGIAEGTTLYLPIPQATYGKVEMKADQTIDGEASVLDGVGIVRGTPEFVNYPKEGAIELVVTSQGLSSALFDFNIATLLGADVKRYFDKDTQIPRVDTTQPVTLPGGIVFNFLGTPAIPTFVMALPKGEHGLWSIGGRLDLNELAEYSGVIFDAVGGGDLDFTKIVGGVFPLFRFFRSGYLPDLNVTTVGSAESVQDIKAKLAIPMGIFTDVKIPALPVIGDVGYADGVFLISGAQTADGFMIPLGLNGGADTGDKEKNPPDGFADGLERTPEIDPFSVPMAPLHSGLQGPHTQYIVATIAASIPSGGEDKRPSAGSATLVRAAAGANLPKSLELPAFLPFPTAPATNVFNAEARTVEFDAVSGADVQRILFKGKRGKHWTFYHVGPESTLTIPTMEALGQSAEDDRMKPENLDSVLINSIDFAASYDPAKLGTPGGIGLDELLRVVDRVSFVDIKKPLQTVSGGSE